MKTIVLFLAISLGFTSIALAKNTNKMCRARLLKRLIGSATGENDPRLAPGIDARVEQACSSRNPERMFQVAREITSSDRYLKHILLPFTNMVGDRYNNPNGDAFTQSAAMMFYFSSTEKSLRQHIFTANRMPIGNRAIHNEFNPPCSNDPVTGGCLNNRGYKTTSISLSLSDGNHSLAHQLYEQGSCDIQSYNDPIGSSSNGCYELANIPSNQVFSQIANTDPNGYIPPDKAAGIMTLPHDKFSRTVFLMGTNRRAVAHTLKTFLCTELPSIRNSSFTDAYVRRDVPRAPAGSIAIYQQVCHGCHAGLDAMANAFVPFDWRDIDAHRKGLITRFAPGQGAFVLPENSIVDSKVNRNNGNPTLGIPMVQDDTWHNLWAEDPRLGFGWKPAVLDGNTIDIHSGNGARELGIVLSHSEAFANCMPQRFFEVICGRELSNEERDQFVSDIRSVTDDDDTLRTYGAAVASHPACTGGQ